MPTGSTYKWIKIPCVWGGINHWQFNGRSTKWAPMMGNPLLETLPLYTVSVIIIAYYISHLFYTCTHNCLGVCNNFVVFRNYLLLATGNQPNQTKSYVASLQCAETTDEKWFGHQMMGRG